MRSAAPNRRIEMTTIIVTADSSNRPPAVEVAVMRRLKRAARGLSTHQAIAAEMHQAAMRNASRSALEIGEIHRRAGAVALTIFHRRSGKR